MKEHDLGKDCLAAGPAYRTVPSREVLPANEVDHYHLANVQVGNNTYPSAPEMFPYLCLGLIVCILSLYDQF